MSIGQYTLIKMFNKANIEDSIRTLLILRSFLTDFQPILT